MKPFNGVQLVQVQPGQSLASRPVASVASRQVTGGAEAYTARKQAVRIQRRHRPSSGSRRRFPGGRQYPGNRDREVAKESPESLARGMLSKGIPVNPGELPTPVRTGYGSTQPERNQVPREMRASHGRRQGRVGEQSYEPIV